MVAESNSLGEPHFFAGSNEVAVGSHAGVGCGKE